MKTKVILRVLLLALVSLFGLCQCGDDYIKLTVKGYVYDENGTPLKDIYVGVVTDIDTTYRYVYEKVNDTLYKKVKHRSDSIEIYKKEYTWHDYTDKDGAYNLTDSEYWDVDVETTGVIIIAADTSGVYESDTIIHPKIWKTEFGDRHGEYKGAYCTQYRFNLKKKK